MPDPLKQSSLQARPSGKDVDTVALLQFIEDANIRLSRERGYDRPGMYEVGVYDEGGVWPMGLACSWDFPDDAFGVPWKVLHRKINRLIDKGYIEGCGCGCRGDWQLTGKGRAALNV